MTNDEEMFGTEPDLRFRLQSEAFVIRVSTLIRNLSFVLRHLFEASRQSHTQRMTATASATQLTPMGIVRVPTVTWA